tara:strand:- start:700 stop:933 length:234 start_codon:yes stop_codon:yes gene_type:complete
MGVYGTPSDLILIEKYENKLRELNNLRDEGHLASDEYNQLVKDFSDVEAIRADINDEKYKVFAEMIVGHLKPLIQKL